MDNETGNATVNKEASAAQPDDTTVTIALDEPLIRGAQRIETVMLRRPTAGALRGLNLVDVVQLNVTALQTLLPRITEPTLTQADVAALAPADLTALGMEVASFLLKKQDRQSYR